MKKIINFSFVAVLFVAAQTSGLVVPQAKAATNTQATTLTTTERAAMLEQIATLTKLLVLLQQQLVNLTQEDISTIVQLQTNMGDIDIELYDTLMPVTTSNFKKLIKSDFYDSTKFHRVIDGFMIQGGDPNSRGEDQSLYGTGGPGYTIEDEFVVDDQLTNERGTISMANTGQPHTGGSQFFINTVDNLPLDFDKQPLTSKHPVFGRVIKGMEVVDAISDVDTGVRDLPVEPVVILDVVFMTSK